MEKSCKKLSWINIISLVVIVIGMVFGILAIKDIPGADQNLKYVFIGVLIVVTVISLISGLITFFGMRKGQIKTSILGMGRNSSIQLLGPLTAFIMGMIGLCNQETVSMELVIFLCATFAIAVFATGLLLNSLKGYRKDKETYSYTAIVSYIATVALVVFAVAALIGQFKIKAVEGSHLVGYLIAFSVCFSLSDILCYVGLAILATIGAKEAPKTTVADADSKTLDTIAQNVNKLAANQNGAAKASEKDNVAQLREYKKLLDDGIITKEEFEKKKKELL